MARLPTYEQLGTATARPQAGAVGYQPTSGQEEAPGAAAARFGEIVQNEAFKQQDLLNTTRAEDAWNKYKSAAIDYSLGADGFTKKKGGAAVNGNLFQTYTKQLSDFRQGLEQNLQDDDVRRKFIERANVTDLQFKDHLLRHYATERADYEKQVYDGALSAAVTMVDAAPADAGIFDTALANVTKRAEALAQFQGVTDPDALEHIRGKVKDALLTTRLESLMYSNPVAADALFRLTAKDISDPGKRDLMQAKLREASLSVQSVNQADAIMREVRAAVPTARAEKFDFVTGKGGFDTAVSALIKREGGYNAKDGKSGAPVNFGINQAANPDIDVKNLTEDQAKQIYKVRYWDAIGGDNLPPDTAMVALDAAALQGVVVARKLLSDSGGDPQVMIEMRRDQLTKLAQRDPQQAPYLTQWMSRLTKLEQQIGSPPPNTSGLPDARDIRAQLPLMMAKIEEKANKLYGADIWNPDRAAFIARTTNELRTKVNQEALQLEAIQKQAQGTLIDFIAGFRQSAPGVPGGVMKTVAPGEASALVTSFSQIQQNPDMLRAWQLADPAAKLGLERLISANARGEVGNDQLYWNVFKKIHAEPGTPDKIDFYQQILQYAGPGKLSMPQVTQLRNEIDRNETPGGRSVGQLMRSSSQRVEQYFKTHVMFTAQPNKQIAATMRWTEDAGKKVDELIKAGHAEQVRDLFTLDSKNSIINPKYLDTYVNTTPVPTISEAARANLPKVANDADYNALQPGAQFVDPQGNIRTKPKGTESSGRIKTREAG